MSYRVGVDIGGTFTDFFVFDESTLETQALKVPSRPDRPGAEVLEGIRQLEARFGIAPGEIAFFSHGTTVGVNTVIQRQGIRLCHFTTEGFVDVLEVARLRTPDVYDLLSKRPAPLIPRERVFPVAGRLASDGSELQPVDRASVEAAIGKAREARAEGIVVALLNAYRNPAHEHEVAAMVQEMAPELPVFCSADVLVNHPRVRAHDHRRHPRLCAAARQPLPGLAAGRAARGGRAGRAACHEVERRGDERRDGQDCLRPDDHVGNRLRRDRRKPCRCALRIP